jgi:SAM-dependent methyltransferase
MAYTRYAYAGDFCRGKDVLDVACGVGQGLGYLARSARRVVGGDFSLRLVEMAQQHYGGRIPVLRLDALSLPFGSATFDLILLYEAIYYLKSPQQFVRECKRVLRPGGHLLVCSVNRDWKDFNPSAFSTRYLTVSELAPLLASEGFETRILAAFPTTSYSMQHRLVSLLKRLAIKLHIMPKTMRGKELLKRLFLGRLHPAPAELSESVAPYCKPVMLADQAEASRFKILFAVGHLCASSGVQVPKA